MKIMHVWPGLYVHTKFWEEKKLIWSHTSQLAVSIFLIHFFLNRAAPVQSVSSTVGSPVVGQNSKMAESEVEPP